MPSPKKTVPGFNRFSGLAAGIMRWAGARRSGNASSIPPNMFRDLENVRFEGQDITCRGGQAQYNPDSILEGCIDGFIPPEFEPRAFAERLITIGEWDQDEARELDLWETAPVDLTDLTRVVALGYLAGAGTGGSGGDYYFSTGTTSADIVDGKVQLFTIDENGDYATSGSSYTVSADDARAVGELCDFEGDRYAVISYDDNSDTHSQVILDPFGTPSVVRDVSGGNGFYPCWLRAVDGNLAAPLEDEGIHYSADGSSWSVAATNVGAVLFRMQPHSAALWTSTLYCSGFEVGGGIAIFAWVGGGGSVATVHTITGAPSTSTIIGTSESRVPLVLHNGVLWYGYALSTGAAKLGKFNGTTWTDAVMEFPADDTTPCHALYSFDGRLWALRGNTIWSSEFPERDDLWRLESTLTDGYGLITSDVVV